MTGALSHHSGLAAEARVAEHYRRRGHEQLRRRWRGRAGEIDLIARDGEGVIFVEVKRARSLARAAERVTRRQLARIGAAAAEFLAAMPAGQLTPARIDVALVDGRGGVEIIENAYGH